MTCNFADDVFRICSKAQKAAKNGDWESVFCDCLYPLFVVRTFSAAPAYLLVFQKAAGTGLAALYQQQGLYPGLLQNAERPGKSG